MKYCQDEMPRLITFDSLETIASKVICEYIAEHLKHFHYRDGILLLIKHSYFKDLSGDLAHILFDRFIETMPWNFQPSLQLMCHLITRLDFSNCPHEIINDNNVQYVMEYCSNISALNLSRCSKITAKCLTKLVTNFSHSLEILVMSEIQYDGNVLEAIGRYCVKLLSLDISDNLTLPRKISYKSLSGLFVINNCRTEVAKTLRTFDMLGVDCPNVQNFIASMFMYWCPQLIRFSHAQAWKGIARLCDFNCGPRPLELEVLGTQWPPIPLAVTELQNDKVNMTMMAKCVPNLKSFYLEYPYLLDANLVYFSTTLSHNLRQLKLSGCFSLASILPIGSICMSLAEVYLNVYHCTDQNSVVDNAFAQHFCDSMESDSMCESKPWSNLISLTVRTHKVPDDSIVPALQSMVMNNTELHTLNLIGFGDVVNKFLQWGVNGNYLKTVEHLRIKLSTLDISLICQLLMKENSLKLLNLTQSLQTSNHECVQLEDCLRKTKCSVDVFYSDNVDRFHK